MGMRRRLTRLAAVVYCCGVLFACGPAGGTGPGMLDMDSDFRQVSLSSQNESVDTFGLFGDQIVVVAGGWSTRAVYDVATGQTGPEEDAWLALNSEVAAIIDAALLDQDTLFAWAVVGGGASLGTLGADGTWQAFAPEGVEEEDLALVHRVLPTEDGGILVTRLLLGEGEDDDVSVLAAVYDLQNGARRCAFSTAFYRDCVIANGQVYFMAFDGLITAYDLATGKMADTIENDSYDMFHAVASFGGTVYTISHTGVMRQGEGGYEKALAGETFLFSDTDATVERLACFDGGFLVLLRQNGVSVLYFLEAVDEIVYTDTVKIFSLYQNPVLDNTIRIFAAVHPEVEIVKEVAGTGEEDFSIQDTITVLNTEILAGAGPDIILLDGLPADSYVRQGVLLELDGLLDTTDIYPGLLEGIRAESGLYMAPTGAQMLVATSAPFATAGSLGDILEELLAYEGDMAAVRRAQNDETPLDDADQIALGYDSHDPLAGNLVQISLPFILSRQDGSIDRELLTGMFRQIQEASDKLELQEPSDSTSYGFAAGGPNDSLVVAVVPQRVYTVLMGQAAYGLATIKSMTDILYYANAPELGFYQPVNFTPMPRAGSGVWVPVGLMGITANSERADLAAEFIQLALSQNVQARNQYGGGPGPRRDSMPVTMSGAAQQYAALQESYTLVYEDAELVFENVYDTLARGAAVPYLVEYYPEEVANRLAVQVCAGELTPEEATESFMAEIEKYQLERD